MSRVTPIKAVSVTIVLAAALAGLLFVFVFGGEGKVGRFPGISLGLTAEASSLMQAGSAFPSDDASQSSYVTGVTAALATSGDLNNTVTNMLLLYPGSIMSPVYTDNKRITLP